MAELAAALGQLDPNLGAVFKHLLADSAGINATIGEVEAEQKAMKQDIKAVREDIQGQIDKLASSIGVGSGSSSGGSGSGIEHMFQRHTSHLPIWTFCPYTVIACWAIAFAK